MTIPTLLNCYAPQRIKSSTHHNDSKLKEFESNDKEDGAKTSLEETTKAHLIHNRTNGDGQPRTIHQLRRLVLDTCLFHNNSSFDSSSSSSGSSLVELGHSKVLAKLVLMTASEGGSGAPSVDDGMLQIRIRFANHFGLHSNEIQEQQRVQSLDETKTLSQKMRNHHQQRMAMKLEHEVYSSMVPSIQLDLYPKQIIRIELIILQNDGNLLSTCCMACSLALADARIEIYDVVTACTVVQFNTPTTSTTNEKKKDNETTILVDPTRQEEQMADATLTLAMMPNWKEVTLWQQQQHPKFGNKGNNSKEMESHVQDSCKLLYKLVKQHLIDKETKRCQQAKGSDK